SRQVPWHFQDPCLELQDVGGNACKREDKSDPEIESAGFLADRRRLSRCSFHALIVSRIYTRVSAKCDALADSVTLYRSSVLSNVHLPRPSFGRRLSNHSALTIRFNQAHVHGIGDERMSVRQSYGVAGAWDRALPNDLARRIELHDFAAVEKRSQVS